jgi:hypothetical protein
MSYSTCEGSAQQLNAFHKSSMEIEMSFSIAKMADIGVAVGTLSVNRRPKLTPVCAENSLLIT